MNRANLTGFACAVAAVCALTFVPAAAQEPSPEAIADAFTAVAGKHAGKRLSGAKGMCVAGSFAPSAEAAGLSQAPHFTKTMPVVGRFSMGGGNPKISDKTKPVTRGFALRLRDEGGDLVLVMISAPVFSTKNPQQLMDFLAVRVPGADGKPDADRVKAFAAAHPETTRQAAWLNARPIPASFAGVDYWGVHAFTLTSSEGAATVVKLKAVPAAGQLGLSDEEAKAKPDDFYADELKSRLATGPADFALVATIGEAGDPTDDVTATWPEESRKAVTLGTLSITGLEPDATCDESTFDPVELPDGIAGPANDPMFAIRSPTYAVTLTRRTE